MIRSSFIVIVILCVAACASKSGEDHYYSLVLAADNMAVPAKSHGVGARLIIGPVLLPAYLNNRGLAIQLGSNQIKIANRHFWAEPLDEAISKVLARDISRRNDSLAVDRDAGRWTDPGDCHLRVEFDKFHATNGSSVVTSGRYWVSSTSTIAKQEFNVTGSLTADGYAHAVEALRGTLDVLATQITDTINSDSLCTIPGD